MTAWVDKRVRRIHTQGAPQSVLHCAPCYSLLTGDLPHHTVPGLPKSSVCCPCHFVQCFHTEVIVSQNRLCTDRISGLFDLTSHLILLDVLYSRRWPCRKRCVSDRTAAEMRASKFGTHEGTTVLALLSSTGVHYN
jgi:hypothetical protein